jgi:hypothetical protein
MDAQSTHALELDDGEHEPGRVQHAGRARLDRTELRRFDWSCRELGRQPGTTETRHGLDDPFT